APASRSIAERSCRLHVAIRSDRTPRGSEASPKSSRYPAPLRSPTALPIVLSSLLWFGSLSPITTYWPWRKKPLQLPASTHGTLLRPCGGPLDRSLSQHATPR